MTFSITESAIIQKILSSNRAQPKIQYLQHFNRSRCIKQKYHFGDFKENYVYLIKERRGSYGYTMALRNNLSSLHTPFSFLTTDCFYEITFPAILHKTERIRTSASRRRTAGITDGHVQNRKFVPLACEATSISNYHVVSQKCRVMS